MPNLKLNIIEYTEIFNAYGALDAHDEPTKVNGFDTMYRVPYKLGSTRRIVIKNMIALKKMIDDFNASRKSILFEIWPDAPKHIDIQSLKPADFPKGKYDEFEKVADEASKAIDENGVELVMLPHKVIYEDGNEFPFFALATLETPGRELIEPKQ